MYKKEKEVFFEKKSKINETQNEYLKSIIGDINPYNSEVPIFIDKILLNKMIENSKDIFNHIQNNGYNVDLNNSNLIGNINKNPHFLTVDFALKNTDKGYVPKLIELQAFPSILSSCFYYLSYYEKHDLLPDFTCNIHHEDYLLNLYKKNIIGNEKRKHVIMLDYKQNTSSTHFNLLKNY